MSEHGSRAYIVAEEPSRLVTIPFEDMLALSERFVAWRVYGARLPDRHVASYLGITPVHLSRLRSRNRD